MVLDAETDGRQQAEAAPAAAERDGVVDRTAAGIQHHGRTVEIVDGAVVLDGSELRLRSEPGDDPGPGGLWVGAPDSEAELPAALDLVGKAVAAGSSLVAVGGGTALTRRLLCEAARLERGGAPVAWDDELDDIRRFFTADPWGNRIELLA